MSHIKEYKVLQNEQLYQLEKSINNYLNDGWELCGGIRITKDNRYYFQSVIKLKDNPEFKTSKYID